MGWNDRLLADVRRHRRAYLALFGASVVVGVFAATFVFSGWAIALTAATSPGVFRVGLLFVVFPVAYAALVWRLLHATAPGAAAPEAT